MLIYMSFPYLMGICNQRNLPKRISYKKRNSLTTNTTDALNAQVCWRLCEYVMQSRHTWLQKYIGRQLPNLVAFPSLVLIMPLKNVYFPAIMENRQRSDSALSAKLYTTTIVCPPRSFFFENQIDKCDRFVLSC